MKRLLLIVGVGLACALAWHHAFATITNQTTQQRSSLGASTVTIAFPFLDNDYISVFLEDTTVTPASRSSIPYGSGAGKFTITGGDPGTTVVMGTAPTSSQRVVVKRLTSKIQPTDYAENEAFPFEDHEEQMDRTIMVLQELGRDVSQKIGLSTASSYTGLTIPDPAADRFLVYNHSATDFTLAPTTTPATGDVLRFSGTGWSSVALSNFGFLSSVTGTAPISSTGSNISISQAGSGTNGYLSSTDWNTFNNKQSALTLGNLTSPTTGVSISGGTGAVVGSGAAVSIQTASGSQPGLLSSSDWNSFDGRLIRSGDTMSGNLVIGANITYSMSSNGVSGTNANLPAHSTAFTRLTNGGLVSIGSIDTTGVASGHRISLFNETGNTIKLTNQYSGAAAGTAIYTGVGGDVSIPNDGVQELIYDSTGTAGWRLSNHVLITPGGASTVLQSNGTSPYYGLLVDANISSSANISRSKIATSTANRVVVNDGSGQLGVSTIPGLVLPTRQITAQDIDWSLSNTFSKTISSNTTFTFSNQVDGQTISVAVRSTSGATSSWPASVSWAGSAPTQTANKIDVYTFIKMGASTFGSYVQGF